MLCNKCGKAVEAEMTYCPHCGKKISEEDLPLVSQKQEEIKSRSPIWFKILLTLVILGTGGLIFTALLSEDLTDIVENHLKALRINKIDEAYYEFTSQDFQEVTPYEAFASFIQRFPIFAENHSVKFNERNVNNNVGTLSAVLKGKTGSRTLIEYKLIKEGSFWKILSIRLEEPPKSQQTNSFEKKDFVAKKEKLDEPSALQFTKFALGNEIDTKSMVTNHLNKFERQGDIYLNLYVKEAPPGTKIEVFFQHLNSKSILAPVTTHLSNRGDSILSYSFSPPSEGWPVGKYRIQAKSSTGVRDFVDFNVE